MLQINLLNPRYIWKYYLILFKELKGTNKYYAIIRKLVDPTKYGVYIIVNKENEEIVYMGMAGKI